MFQLNVFIHVVSAMVWVGGMLFLVLVVAPATRRLAPAERGAIFSIVGQRFRLVGWVCLALLMVTGVLNVAFRGVSWSDVVSGRLLASEFGRVLVAKLVLIAVMIVLSTTHDLLLGPASSATRAGSPPSRAIAARRRASMAGRINTVLALLVVALAVVLVRGIP